MYYNRPIWTHKRTQFQIILHTNSDKANQNNIILLFPLIDWNHKTVAIFVLQQQQNISQFWILTDKTGKVNWLRPFGCRSNRLSYSGSMQYVFTLSV